jgi:outer membrane immunogenic protein
MKKLALSVAALALTAGAALAADLPSRKAPILPPPPPPPPMWTGFYVGLNAGGGWSASNGQYIGVGPVGADATWATLAPGFQANYLAAFATAASASGNNSNNGGFIGGGQIGYNWQFYNSLVAGLEADIQGVASSSGGRTLIRSIGINSAPTAPHAGSEIYTGITSARGNLQYIGTVRGRLGWLFTPTLLLYGTGGLAYGGVTLNTATSVTSSGSPWADAQPVSFGGVNFSNTQVGWTAGGGLEWMFFPNWSAKVEYLYYDLGTVTQNFSIVASDPVAPTGSAVFGGQARARINGNIVRAGVNYHFNWGSAAPVVAKY